MWNFLPAIIGAAGSLISSNQQSQAINNATAAQSDAADQQLQMYRDAQVNSQRILGKYSASGDAARSRMMAFLRLPQSAATAGSQPLTYSSFAGGSSTPDGSLPTPLSTANGGLPSLSQMIHGGNDPSLYNAISNGNISNPDWWATGGPSLSGQALASVLGIRGRGNGGSAVDQWGTPQENAGEAQGFDGAAYLNQNGDLVSAFNNLSDRDQRYIATSFDFDGNGRIDQNEYGNWHYQTYGRDEGRAAPASAPGAAPTTALGSASAAAAASGTQTLDEAYEEAWAEYEQTPWGQLAQTTADQARDDFTSMAGAQGSTLSGRTARGMAEVANQAKQSAFNQYYTALGGMADQGFSADTGIASAGQTYANSASNVLAANANAQASGALARGQAQADGMNDLASWIGWGMGNWGSMGGSPSSTSSFSPSSVSQTGGTKTSGLSRIR